MDSDEPSNEVEWMLSRQPYRNYVSKSFSASFGRDQGQPSRYISQVFDEDNAAAEDGDCDEPITRDESTHVIGETPKGRKQIRLHIVKDADAGVVREVCIQKVPTNSAKTKLDSLLTLDREQSAALIRLIRSLEAIPPDRPEKVRVDDDLLKAVFSDPEPLKQIYQRDSEQLNALIRSDVDARDVIALEHRQKVVADMRKWLEDDEAFDAAANEAGGPEKAWQRLLDREPWILGIGLSGQLFTSWDKGRLEQVTTGSSITGPGKRPDALMRTNGIIRSLAFAEIKHHRTPIQQNTAARPGAYAPSKELVEAIVQVQETVRKAKLSVGEQLNDKNDDGSLTGAVTFNTQPRAFLVLGSGQFLTGDGGGPISEKVHSFESFRRNITHPEILTFDELLARAEWHVELAKKQEEQSEH